jgi:hypothetical protein
MLIPRFSFVGTHRFVLLPSPLARAFDRWSDREPSTSCCNKGRGS